MGTNPSSYAYPTSTTNPLPPPPFWSNWYIVPVLGSCSINMFQYVVSPASIINPTPSGGYTSPVDVLTLSYTSNSTPNTTGVYDYYMGIDYSPLTTNNINLLLCFGGASSFDGSGYGGIKNIYLTSTSAYYYNNYSKTLFSVGTTNVVEMFNGTEPSNVIYNGSDYQIQLINSAYTLAYYIFYLYLYNDTGMLNSDNTPSAPYSPIFQGMDFDLENFDSYGTYSTGITGSSYYDYVLYTGILSQTIKYLSTISSATAQAMTVSHAPQTPYFNVVNVSPYDTSLSYGFLPTTSSATGILNFSGSYACLYQLIEQCFSNYIDFYNIQFYNQNDDYTGTSFTFGTLFIVDNEWNSSVLQLYQSTYLSDQTSVPDVPTSTPYSAIWSTGYNWDYYSINYSSAGVYPIPLNKIVIGLLCYLKGGDSYAPLSPSSFVTYPSLTSEYPLSPSMSAYISDCTTATSPYSETGQLSTSPFYYNTEYITSWYTSGGIMIYDYESNGTTGDTEIIDNNNDVSSYFTTVYNSRTT